MDDALRNHLDELEQLIRDAKADGHISDDERSEIGALVERIRDDIAAEENDGLSEQVEEAAIRFEGRHPRVAELFRSVVHTLTGYGM